MSVKRLAALSGLALQLGLHPAQVEEQRFLRRGRPGPHHRPVAHHIILDTRLDPPDRIGGKPNPPVRVKLVRRFHQPKAGFLDQIVHRRAIAAELCRHRDRQAHIGRDQAMQGLLVALVAPGIGKAQFGFRVQQFCLHRLARHGLVGISVECHLKPPSAPVFLASVTGSTRDRINCFATDMEKCLRHRRCPIWEIRLR